MVYIRPSSPVITTSTLKPLTDSPEKDLSSGGGVVANAYIAKPETERRKMQDRRQARKEALLETRTGKDRRKNHASISIII